MPAKKLARTSTALSLKWQLSVALVGLAMSLMIFYVAIAKQTFESDKIAYIFESRQFQLQRLSTDFVRKIDRAVRDCNLIFSGFDPQTKTLNSVARDLFDSHETLVALRVIDLSSKTILFQIGKTEAVQAKLREPALAAKSKTTAAFTEALDATRFLISAGEGKTGQIFVEAIAEIPELLDGKVTKGIVALIDRERVIGTSRPIEIPQSLVRELSQDRREQTFQRRFDGDNYLLSTSEIPNSNLSLVAIDSEKAALGALEVLFKRSIVFGAFAFFLTVFVSLLISAGLTNKLTALTVIAGKIGQGDFSNKPVVSSTNEIGMLQSAFVRMIDEIQSLLIATKEKVRMEEELKTARLVQDQLFPSNRNFEVASLRVSGRYDTSTECGGDWWYYYQVGDELFVVVADATGHGTPAALSTAASRSLFSHLEQNPNLTLSELASAWDRSIADSSGQKIFMTALMVKINVLSGRGSAISASHEPPILIDAEGNAVYWTIKPSLRLGEKKDLAWNEEEFSLEPGTRLFLFTDGLWAVENAEKKTMSESRFLRKLAKVSRGQAQIEDLLTSIDRMVQDHRQGTNYPDDVTLVLIDRLGA